MLPRFHAPALDADRPEVILDEDEGRHLSELLKSDPEVTEHLEPIEIEDCFDAARYVASAAPIFERLEAL